MNKKQVLILWIIAALLGVAVAAVRINQNKGPLDVTKFSRGDQLFQDLPVRELTTIKIADHEQSTTLEKGRTGWVVKERADYPVNIAMLAGLLDNFNEVKVGQGLEAGASYNSRFGMDSGADNADDHGLLLTLTAPGKEPWTISLGKTTAGEFNMMDPMAPRDGGGRYVRVSTDSDSIYVIEETFPRVTADPKDWLRENFLEIDGLQSVTLRAPEDDGFEPWILSRVNRSADFTLTGIGEDEELISSVVDPLKSLFSYARFEDVLSPEDAKDLQDPAQSRQATITTFDGLIYTINIAPRRAETSEDQEETAPPAPNYLLTVTVSANLPGKRTPAADESDEDKARLDAEFAEQQQSLREKLAKDQSLQDRVFEVTKWTVDALLKSRADFVRIKETVEPPAPAPDIKDAFGFPNQ